LLTVGAVNVRTGNFVYFDNKTHTIRPEHVMASGALPPGFPGSRSRANITGTAATAADRKVHNIIHLTYRARGTFQGLRVLAP
jgi:predicted acylesterase/phospholipase RssA